VEGCGMSYEAGLLKYIVKGVIFNFVPMYIFGAGVLAVINAAPHFFQGEFLIMTVDYFFTKYLPPTSLGQIVFQSFAGSFWAGIKWYIFTPRL
jgi:hypothetical protein